MARRDSKIRWAVCVAACLCASPSHAQSLGDELQNLLTDHPQIQSKAKSVSAAAEGIGAARAGFLPTVKLNGDVGPQYVDSQDRRENQGQPYFRNRETSGLTVTQHLYDGEATQAAVSAAEVSRDISDADLRTTRQNVMLEGVTAYVSVLKATRMIDLAHESERKVQEQLQLEDERVEKGAGLASDVLAAKQRLQTAKEARVRYEGEFQAAVAKYTQVFGHAPDLAALAEPPLPEALLPKTIDEALAVADKENPSIETARDNVELTGQKRRGAEAGWYPTLDLVGHAAYNDGNDAVTGLKRDMSVLVAANWEIFSGFKTQSLVKQAAHEHGASLDNHVYAGRKVFELTRTSWYKLSTARERMGLLNNAANLAEALWKAMRERHEAGKATITEVLDSEIKINDARINYLGAYYDMVAASYELLGAMGRMEAEAASGTPPAPPG